VLTIFPGFPHSQIFVYPICLFALSTGNWRWEFRLFSGMLFSWVRYCCSWLGFSHDCSSRILLLSLRVRNGNCSSFYQCASFIRKTRAELFPRSFSFRESTEKPAKENRFDQFAGFDQITGFLTLCLPSIVLSATYRRKSNTNISHSWQFVFHASWEKRRQTECRKKCMQIISSL